MSTTPSKDTPWAALVRSLAKIEPQERASVGFAFLLFFCVLCGYFMLRPIRETIGTVLGEEEVEHLFGATFWSCLAVIPIYGLACAKLPRTVVLSSVYAIFAGSLLVLAYFMKTDPDSVAAARFFFVWISVFNLFVVSVFWTLLVDRSSSEQAKRLFGFIAAGGTIGGLVAPQLTGLLIDPVGRTGVLVVSAGLFVVAIVCQAALLRTWRRDLDGGPAMQRPIGGNPFAGVLQVIKSPYLLAFCAFVLLLAAANTFLYFEQLRIVKETFADENERTKIFGYLDFTVQALTLLTQVFFTSRIASRLGVVVLLVSVPIAMVGGFIALAMVANFWILALVIIARRAGEYALTRPGREILFTSVDTETKYKAKNLIDVVVYRGGDWLTAMLRGGLRAGDMSYAAIAWVGAGLAALWAIVGYWLARKHEANAGKT